VEEGAEDGFSNDSFSFCNSAIFKSRSATAALRFASFRPWTEFYATRRKWPESGKKRNTVATLISSVQWKRARKAPNANAKRQGNTPTHHSNGTADHAKGDGSDAAKLSRWRTEYTQWRLTGIVRYGDTRCSIALDPIATAQERQ
jgi:hypothetical protein